jgi:hypothetical protein
MYRHQHVYCSTITRIIVGKFWNEHQSSNNRTNIKQTHLNQHHLRGGASIKQTHLNQYHLRGGASIKQTSIIEISLTNINQTNLNQHHLKGGASITPTAIIKQI